MKTFRILILLTTIVVLFFGLFAKTAFVLYSVLSSLRNELIGAILGVPVVVVSIGSILFAVIKHLIKKLID